MSGPPSLPQGATNLPYEEALQMLSDMFSDWDRETLAVVLESNGYHVESTSKCFQTKYSYVYKSDDTTRFFLLSSPLH
jgi:hypothetical protein